MEDRVASMMVDSGRMPRRILHTSDLHLVSLGDKPCHSLEALGDLVFKTKADLVIIAGDLFDDNKVDDDLLRFVVGQLRSLGVDTVVLPGNHDCLSQESIYQREDLWKSAPNVHIFRAPYGETLSFPDLGISVWGKPNSSFTGDGQPLAGIPQGQNNEQWHVAVAHGYYVGTERHLPWSFQITQGEIIASCQDYIALGHSVAFRCVFNGPVKAYYSGSPSESGIVAVVDLIREGEVQVTPHSI